MHGALTAFSERMVGYMSGSKALQIVDNEVWWLCRRATTTTMRRTGVITMKMDIITTTTMKKVSK